MTFYIVKLIFIRFTRYCIEMNVRPGKRCYGFHMSAKGLALGSAIVLAASMVYGNH